MSAELQPIIHSDKVYFTVGTSSYNVYLQGQLPERASNYTIHGFAVNIIDPVTGATIYDNIPSSYTYDTTSKFYTISLTIAKQKEYKTLQCKIATKYNTSLTSFYSDACVCRQQKNFTINTFRIWDSLYDTRPTSGVNWGAGSVPRNSYPSNKLNFEIECSSTEGVTIKNYSYAVIATNQTLFASQKLSSGLYISKSIDGSVTTTKTTLSIFDVLAVTYPGLYNSVTFVLNYETSDGITHQSTKSIPIEQRASTEGASCSIMAVQVNDNKLSYTIQYSLNEIENGDNYEYGYAVVRTSLDQTIYTLVILQDAIDWNSNLTSDTLTLTESENFTDYNVPFKVLFTLSVWNSETNEIQQSVFCVADFCITTEDIVLTDATASYKIRYNPQVTNLKYAISDVVTPTLGGTYPFITRNGHQRYRTFTLGGMISCAEDSNLYANESSKDWTQQERSYRDRLLEFLHNDKVKLFQSGPEGCMLVRLTNVSLNSEAKLGRNIYSFSATATEVDDLSNIAKYNILNRG